MPYRSSFWGQPLPDNATLDATNQTAWSAEIIRQSGLSSPWLNATTWTAEHIIAPADQPLIPVACSHDTVIDEILHLGVPIPPGTKPTADSDAALTIYQPDYVDADGFQGRYYELQGVRIDPVTGAYSCNFAARAVGVNTSNAGRFVNWTASGEDPSGYATDADSTYQLQVWGAQGSGLPYWCGVISAEDIKRGSIDHALLLEVVDAKSGAHVWPAVARSDGGSATSALIEGQRGRLPANYTIPSGHDELETMIIKAWMKYGFVITDRTLSSLAHRMVPSAGFGNRSLNLPWGDVQLLVVGSDTNQTPTS